MKKKLVWDKTGERLYETGVSQGVLYPIQTGGVYNSGTAWNGLSTVTESPSGAEPTAIYADNSKYLNLMSAEEFGGTIEAYMAPDEFAECDGSKEIAPGVFAGQQNRKMFGLSYKTLLGNDVDSNDYGYKLHLVYGCLASPSEKGYSTVNDSPEAITLSWEFSTTPVEIATLIDEKKLKPTSILTFDSTKVDAKKLAALEEILPLQQGDFEEMYKELNGLPMTIRFLDPPLHEFVPTKEDEIAELAGELNISVKELKEICDSLHETNPMMGHRGLRLAVTYPEIAKMQTKAVIRAAINVSKETGVQITPEIMIPLSCDCLLYTSPSPRDA